MKLAEEPCHPWICKWECWSCVIPALLSSAAAQKRKSKGRDVSVFHSTSEGKLIHCASFKINRRNISNIHHLSFSSQTKLLLLLFCFFCLIVLLPRGSKHEESPMIWFGAEQVNPLCGVMQCVNTLQKEDQYTAQAGMVSRVPHLYSVVAVFQHFQSESRQDIWDPLSAAKLTYCSGPKQWIIMS